jgi:hypothetical protein
VTPSARLQSAYVFPRRSSDVQTKTDLRGV